MRVIVVGGGITGLVAAHELARAGVEVELLEREDRLGGKIRTERLAGTAIDVGADAFLGRQPEARHLAARLGFTAALRAPLTGRVWLGVEGGPRRLPANTVFGVPTDPVSLARSNVLSPSGLWEAIREPFRPRSEPLSGDTSVAELVGERFGTEVVDRLVEPLLGGVYAGRADELSVRATIPPLAAAAEQPGSLRRGLREHRSAPSDDPVFLTLDGGLGQLVDRLRDGVPRILPGVEARSVVATADGWSVVADDGEREADAVVLATPAWATASILEDLSPMAARELGQIRYASVAVVSLAVPRAAMRRVPSGSGLLVPRSRGTLVKAVTWSSWKWPHVARAADPFLLRASVGRVGEPPPKVSDEDLVGRVVRELSQLAGVSGSPLASRVTRWDDSLPQYEVGHRARVDRIRVALRRDAPGVHVTGAAYDGVGIAHCVRQGQEVAALLSR
ncbi:MAG: protoporphyrinogen oxidase [Nitriliruptorales bacterium]|nr:protoporphyrinogen oxidase [Nitriliruptorales bacterium]